MPFILGAIIVIAAVLVLSTVHTALSDADAEEAQTGPSRERQDAEAAVWDVPAIPEEAILAKEALLEDRDRDDNQDRFRARL